MKSRLLLLENCITATAGPLFSRGTVHTKLKRWWFAPPAGLSLRSMGVAKRSGSPESLACPSVIRVCRAQQSAGPFPQQAVLVRYRSTAAEATPSQSATGDLQETLRADAREEEAEAALFVTGKDASGNKAEASLSGVPVEGGGGEEGQLASQCPDSRGEFAAVPGADTACSPTEGIQAQPLMPELVRWVEALPADIRYIMDRLGEAGGHAWMVGGCVRDVVSGKIPREVDVTTTLLPEQVLHVFDGEPGTRVVPHKTTGGAFGTISVQRGSAILEVTTLRKDGTYSDGRRPDEVTYTTQLFEDLARRDFTMNAAAVDPGYPPGDRAPALYDPFNGVGDARARVLRMVGDPAVRLCDDGLRVWRAYRFLDAGPQGLRSLDPTLEAALRSAPVQKAAGRASRERIWEEMIKLLVGANAAGVLTVMAEHGALCTALPNLPPEAVAAKSRGVRAQQHLLHAWQRWLEHAPLRGIDLHSGRAGGKATPSGAEDEGPSDKWLLALDIEATCDLASNPHPQEVVELAAALLDSKTFEVPPTISFPRPPPLFSRGLLLLCLIPEKSASVNLSVLSSVFHALTEHGNSFSVSPHSSTVLALLGYYSPTPSPSHSPSTPLGIALAQLLLPHSSTAKWKFLWGLCFVSTVSKPQLYLSTSHSG
eukprot:jgi/Botrbrau1/3115/Bobra.0070s0090.4